MSQDNAHLSQDDERRLVFGDDGSPGADVAWLWINNHTWQGWRLEIIAAAGWSPAAPGSVSVADGERQRPPPRSSFVHTGFTRVEQRAPAQDPRVALSVAADLLVIGARGPGMLKALRLGSTAEWLLIRPPAPTVVVRHGRPVRRVVLACDGSAHAQAATDALCSPPFADRIHVDVIGVNGDGGSTDDAVAAASAQLRGVCGRVEAHVVEGNPTQVLMSSVDRIRPDLLVLGTRGRTGFVRLRLGSTAYELTRSVPCSVLIARDPAEIEHDPANSATGLDTGLDTDTDTDTDAGVEAGM